MAIRDMDMYCNGLVKCVGENSDLLPYQCIKVAGNRGASGIDGLLSTATGFAVGCKRRVSVSVALNFVIGSIYTSICLFQHKSSTV